MYNINTSKVIWLYGLSGAGKTTLANKLVNYFNTKKILTILLDADILRAGINSNLGFSKEDRKENVRRIAEVAKLFLVQGIIPVVTAITPYEQNRQQLSEIIGSKNVLLLFINCPMEKCEQRDVKGLYQKARQGIIKNFTGIGDSFEMPINNPISVNTDTKDTNQSFEELLKIIYANT